MCMCMVSCTVISLTVKQNILIDVCASPQQSANVESLEHPFKESQPATSGSRDLFESWRIGRRFLPSAPHRLCGTHTYCKPNKKRRSTTLHLVLVHSTQKNSTKHTFPHEEEIPTTVCLAIFGIVVLRQKSQPVYWLVGSVFRRATTSRPGSHVVRRLSPDNLQQSAQVTSHEPPHRIKLRIPELHASTGFATAEASAFVGGADAVSFDKLPNEVQIRKRKQATRLFGGDCRMHYHVPDFNYL